MTEPRIVGWRLDLARNHLYWGRGRYLSAKAELFALIAKVQSGVMPKCVYTSTSPLGVCITNVGLI